MQPGHALAHHRRLEATCEGMLACAYANDLRGVVIAWGAFERDLCEHLTAEEELILPSYARHAACEARRILDEHGRVRAIVAAMRVDVELHQIRVSRLLRLVDALETHADHEESTMYPWAERHLASVARRSIDRHVAG